MRLATMNDPKVCELCGHVWDCPSELVYDASRDLYVCGDDPDGGSPCQVTDYMDAMYDMEENEDNYED
jgi:hypothetical protein